MMTFLTDRLAELFGSRSRRPKRRRPSAPRARLSVEQLETRFAPANFNWTGAASALWSNPNNWAGGPAGAVPNAADTANFFAGTPNCTVDNGAAFGGTVENLDINSYGGTITLARNLTVSNQFTQNSGTVDLGGTNNLTTQNAQLASGTATIKDGGTFAIPNALSIFGNVTFSGLQVVDGPVLNSVTWSGGTISLIAGAKFTNVNGATFTVASNSTLSGSGTFTNNGSFIKSGSTGTTIISADFDNTGTGALVSVLGGTLQFLNNVGTHDAEFRTATNTLIQFTAPGGASTQTLNQGTKFTGSGKVKVDSLSTLAVAANAGVTASCTFELASAGGGLFGKLMGPGSFTSSGDFIWDGGEIGDSTGGTALTVSVSGQLDIHGGITNEMFSTQFSTSAVGTWSGTNDIQMSSSTITNSGTLTVTNDQTINRVTGTTNSFVNTGTLIKTAGNVGTTIKVPFANNGGTLNVNGLKISFPDYDITQTAGQTLLGGGTLGLGRALGVPIGTFTVSGGKVSGTGTIDGYLTMTAGTIDLGTAVGTLIITGSYSQANGVILTLKLGGKAAGQYDQLSVGGIASLAGTLQLEKIGTFVPAKGDKFAKIVHAVNGLRGTFTMIVDHTGSGLTWTQTAGPNDLDITGN
jgi:hypothetical protein